MDFATLSVLIGFIAVILSMIGCAIGLHSSNRTFASEIKADVHAIRADVTELKVTLARQDSEFRGIMAKQAAELDGKLARQNAELDGRLAKQDAEFKMFLSCGRLPARSTRLRASLNS